MGIPHLVSECFGRNPVSFVLRSVTSPVVVSGLYLHLSPVEKERTGGGVTCLPRTTAPNLNTETSLEYSFTLEVTTPRTTLH